MGGGVSDYIDIAIADAGLDMQVDEAEPGIYHCTLTSTTNPDFNWQRDLNTKAGHGAPGIGNVLYHYALRAQEVSQYNDVLEWSEDNGRNLNDPQTIPEFTQLVQDKTDLRLLLSEPVYQKMMAGLEIHQAISCAMPRSEELD